MPRSSDPSDAAAAFLSEAQEDVVFRHGQERVRSDRTAELLRLSPAARTASHRQRRIH